MKDFSQKSSKELAAELENQMPEIKSWAWGWRRFGNVSGVYPAQKVYELAKLVLAQQREIQQLKAELQEVRRALMDRER
jgi:hypothetical protein